MISHEHNNGVLWQPKIVEFRNHSAHVLIDERTGRQIGLNYLSGFCLRGVAADEQIGILGTDRCFGKSVRNRWPRGKIGW